MKTLLTILVLIFSLTSIGQKMRLGIKLLPGLTDVYEPFEEQTFQNRLHPRGTFNYGIQFIHFIKDSTLFLETGIYYADRGAHQVDFVSLSVTSSGTDTLTSDVYSHSYFISIPILFRYERKFFYTSIGPSLEYYVRTKNIYTPDLDKTTISRFSKGFPDDLKFGADLNLGLQFNISERIGGFVEGSLHFGRFIKDPVNLRWSYYKTYEIGLGLTYLIK